MRRIKGEKIGRSKNQNCCGRKKNQLNADTEGLHAQFLTYLEREGFVEESSFPTAVRSNLVIVDI
jgi:hypothetical protein